MAAGMEGLARVDGVQNNLVAYDHLEWKGPTEIFSKQVSCSGGRGRAGAGCPRPNLSSYVLSCDTQRPCPIPENWRGQHGMPCLSLPMCSQMCVCQQQLGFGSRSRNRLQEGLAFEKNKATIPCAQSNGTHTV